MAFFIPFYHFVCKSKTLNSAIHFDKIYLLNKKIIIAEVKTDAICSWMNIFEMFVCL